MRVQKLELDLHMSDTECARAKEGQKTADKELDAAKEKLEGVMSEKNELSQVGGQP
jgi:exonuclease VII small subunit